MKPRALLERLARPFSSRRDKDKEEEADLEAIAAREQRAFRYETLAAATRGFSEKNRLGQGGFGPVYRGRLADGRDVAVKRLGAGSRQGAREFRNEATLLSRVQHRNVVNLIGYCARGAEDKLLVYEYVPNESLDKILFSPSSSAAAAHCPDVLGQHLRATWMASLASVAFAFPFKDSDGQHLRTTWMASLASVAFPFREKKFSGS